MIAILIYFCLIIYKLLYLPPIKTIFFYWNIENYFCFFIFEYIFINAFIWFNSCSDAGQYNNCELHALVESTICRRILFVLLFIVCT